LVRTLRVMLCRVTIEHNSKPKRELDMRGLLDTVHVVVIQAASWTMLSTGWGKNSSTQAQPTWKYQVVALSIR
jgi:hypothetical protein